MASFADILLSIRLESIDREESRDQDQEVSDSSLMGDESDPMNIGGDDGEAVIRAGLNLRPDFWDDFISLTNNSGALANLLKVDDDRVSQWGVLISKALDKIKQKDTPESDSDSKRNNMVHTGGFK